MSAQALSPDVEGWSPRRIALLREHHALGLSAAQSAELLGEVSRYAVIAKRSRLGLVAVCGVTDAPREKARPADRLAGFHRPPLLRCEPLPSMAFPLPAGTSPKRLVDRRTGECAWPLGEAEAEGDHMTQFCCAPVAERSSYCACHATIARSRP